MENQQPKHNDKHKSKPFDPIAELVAPDLAKLSQEQRDISYIYAIYALFALGIFATKYAARFISTISSFC